jgi:hypothetical protein
MAMGMAFPSTKISIRSKTVDVGIAASALDCSDAGFSSHDTGFVPWAFCARPSTSPRGRHVAAFVSVFLPVSHGHRIARACNWSALT